MTERTYFRLTLLLPILVPLLAVGWIGLAGAVGGVSGILVLSLAFGGASYVAVAIGLWLALATADRSRALRLALLAPWLMAIVVTLAHPLTGWVIFHPTATGPDYNWLFFGKEGASLGLIAVFLGYGYVALALIGRTLGNRLGLITLGPPL